MTLNIFTITLFCRYDRVDGKNEAPLYLSVNQGDIRRKVSLNIKLDVKYWDQELKTIKQGCPNKSYYELLFNKKKQEIERKIIQANLEEKILSVDDFLDTKKKKEERHFVKSYFEKYIKELKAEGRYKNALYYVCCLNCLLDFTKKKDVEFKQIDAIFLSDFAHWMKVEKKLKTNTIGNRLRGLKAIFNRAIRNKVITPDVFPFNEFQLGQFREQTIKRAISKSDVEKVVNLDLRTISDAKTFPFYDLAKDVFIFSYLGAGINLVDIVYLKYRNIVEGDHVYFYRKKTKKLISFKLHPKALEIIQKYKTAETRENDYIFPILDDSKHVTAADKCNRVTYKTRYINKYLKKIGEYLNISLPLTTYVARHSFATVLKRSGVQTSIISEAMGHSSEKVTQIYLDSFDNEQIDKAMQHLL